MFGAFRFVTRYVTCFSTGPDSTSRLLSVFVLGTTAAHLPIYRGGGRGERSSRAHLDTCIQIINTLNLLMPMLNVVQNLKNLTFQFPILGTNMKQFVVFAVLTVVGTGAQPLLFSPEGPAKNGEQLIELVSKAAASGVQDVPCGGGRSCPDTYPICCPNQRSCCPASYVMFLNNCSFDTAAFCGFETLYI